MTEEEPIKLSWTSLSNHETCHQKASLFRKHLQNPTMDTRNFLGGSVCDRILRNWLLDPKPGAMVEMVDQEMDDVIQEDLDNEKGVVHWRNKGDQNSIKAKCRKALEILEPILYELVIPYDYEGAKRFSVPFELPYSEDEMRPVLLVGETDLTIRDDDGRYQILDLKITANSAYWKKTYPQLIFYDLVFQTQYGAGPCSRTALLQPLLPHSILDFHFTDDEYRQMWARIHQYALDIWRGVDFPKEDNDGCEYCPVYHACEKFNQKTPEGKLRLVGEK